MLGESFDFDHTAAVTNYTWVGRKALAAFIYRYWP